MIYELVLAPKDGVITIRSMHPERYDQLQADDHASRRSSYPKAVTVPSSEGPSRVIQRTTTYERYELRTRYQPRTRHQNGHGILSVNRLIRSEATPVFYSGNSFKFDDADAVVPFFKDRTALEPVRSIELDFTMFFPRHQSSHQSWFKACDYISKELEPEDLSLRVEVELGHLRAPIEQKISQIPWIVPLISMRNLISLNVLFNYFGTSCGPQFQEAFTAYLRSKMLRCPSESDSRSDVEPDSISKAT